MSCVEWNIYLQHWISLHKSKSSQTSTSVGETVAQAYIGQFAVRNV